MPNKHLLDHVVGFWKQQSHVVLFTVVRISENSRKGENNDALDKKVVLFACINCALHSVILFAQKKWREFVILVAQWTNSFQVWGFGESPLQRMAPVFSELWQNRCLFVSMTSGLKGLCKTVPTCVNLDILNLVISNRNQTIPNPWLVCLEWTNQHCWRPFHLRNEGSAMQTRSGQDLGLSRQNRFIRSAPASCNRLSLCVAWPPQVHHRTSGQATHSDNLLQPVRRAVLINPFCLERPKTRPLQTNQPNDGSHVMPFLVRIPVQWFESDINLSARKARHSDQTRIHPFFLESANCLNLGSRS